jgi:rhodanese-related sulfurtransferase
MKTPGNPGTAAGVVFVSLLAMGGVRAGDTAYRAPEQVAGAETVSVDEAMWLFEDGAVFIDVRNPRLFARRHVPGAHHLDIKDTFTRDALAAVAGKEQPVVLYSSGVKCGRAYRAGVLAVSWGYRRIYYFRGGMADWKNAGFPMASGAGD